MQICYSINVSEDPEMIKPDNNPMIRHLNPIAGLFFMLGLWLGYLQPVAAADNKIIAINIALDPDAAMANHAKTANARMLLSYPAGFALDASHAPHITLLQRYVRTENLANIFKAVDKVLAGEEDVKSLRLTAARYSFSPWDKAFLGSVVLDRNDGILKLQQKLIETMAPFTEKTGTAAAFFTTQAEPDISKITIDYVETFVPERTGKNYLPHLTLGFASQTCKMEMAALPFKTFTFSPSGVSIYQIGNFGTARKKLKESR